VFAHRRAPGRWGEIQSKAPLLPASRGEMRARRGEFDTIIPTGRKSEEIVLGYGNHHAGALNCGLCPGGIAHQGKAEERPDPREP
jgi:hypothetical protein